MIELVDVNKSFSGKQVLFDINAQFKAGVPNLIIGASGGGKSVLMKSMVGLLKPESGKIIYEKTDILQIEYKELREVRKQIGMLFQGGALFDSMTVEQNIDFPLKMFSGMNLEERRDRVNFCLKRVNMEGINDKYPSEISGGMKKRVGIARAIALNIKFLFCDEPNSGLDPITSRLIDDLLLEITEEYNITTIINSHDMKTVFDIGYNIIFIYQGKVCWNGNNKDLVHAKNDIPELLEFINASYFD
jgi:phospholipid/cholesterol/gamma-HCH transport system ATP-binding protein